MTKHIDTDSAPHRNQNKQDRLFMNMPAKHERGITTKCQRCQKGFVCCALPKFGQVDLFTTSPSQKDTREKEQTLTSWKAIVTMNVCTGLTLGMTAKTVSPTSPREVEATPKSLTAIELIPLHSTTVCGVRKYNMVLRETTHVSVMHGLWQ